MIGLDVVDVERFRRTILRSPGFVDRFFTSAEKLRCIEYEDPVVHLAGIFAAKEATMKALGGVPAVAYARRIEISHDGSGALRARLDGTSIKVSIAQDGGYAVAVAVGSLHPPWPGLGDPPARGRFNHDRTRRAVHESATPRSRERTGEPVQDLVPNLDLARYLRRPLEDLSRPSLLVRDDELVPGSDFP